MKFLSILIKTESKDFSWLADHIFDTLEDHEELVMFRQSKLYESMLLEIELKVYGNTNWILKALGDYLHPNEKIISYKITAL